MAAPRHRPYRQAGAAFQIGLRPMPPETWLETGPDHAAFMAAKRQRLAGLPPQFFHAMPESRAAQAELRDAVVAHLLAQHTEHFTRSGDVLEDRIDGSRHDLADAMPLALLGRILEEDFILFQTIDGQDLITAACNAYTSSGRIVSSVGRGMHFAHDPVPGLNEQLGPRIDRVLANVQVGTPVVRFNWFLTPISARLFPDGPHDANVAIGAEGGREPGGRSPPLRRSPLDQVRAPDLHAPAADHGTRLRHPHLFRSALVAGRRSRESRGTPQAAWRLHG